MSIFTIEDFETEVNSTIEPLLGSHHAVFRGHAKNSYENLPTICRSKMKPQEILLYDRLLQFYFRLAITKNGYIGSVKLHPGFGTQGFLKSWLRLTQQRHLELPSRLQDWTMNKLIALYFAVSNVTHHNEDGHVWVLLSPTKYAWSNDENFNERMERKYLHLNAGDADMKILDGIDPFNLEKTVLVHYAHSAKDWLLQVGEVRRGAQGGKFIVCPTSVINVPLDKQFIGHMMRKIEIPAAAKPNLLALLTARGYSNHTLLPSIPSDTKKILEKVNKRAIRHLNFCLYINSTIQELLKFFNIRGGE